MPKARMLSSLGSSEGLFVCGFSFVSFTCPLVFLFCLGALRGVLAFFFFFFKQGITV